MFQVQHHFQILKTALPDFFEFRFSVHRFQVLFLLLEMVYFLQLVQQPMLLMNLLLKFQVNLMFPEYQMIYLTENLPVAQKEQLFKVIHLKPELFHFRSDFLTVPAELHLRQAYFQLHQ